MVGALVAMAFGVSCGGPSYVLPNRSDSKVQKAESRIALTVGAARNGAECEVRLIGEADGSSFVWAHCYGPSGGISAPMRVTGDKVETPGDGSLYSEDVRRIFPIDLAGEILNDPEHLRP